MINKNYISKNAKVAKDVVLNSPVRLYGSANLKKNCVIGKYSFVNDKTTLYSNTIVGRYCSIGKSCEIGVFEHPKDWLSTSPFQYNMKIHFPDYVDNLKQCNIKRPKNTLIGNDIWIGSLVVINRGIKIGDGAIVAAGAFVTEDVPPYAIVGGVPAKVLKYRFEDSIIKKLLKLKWWNLNLKELTNVDFDDIHKSINQIEKIISYKKLVETSKKIINSKNNKLTSSEVDNLIKTLKELKKNLDI